MSTKKPTSRTPKVGRPPAAQKTPYTAAITVKLRPEDKQELERRALSERHARQLSRYGVSDYVRELLERALQNPE